MKMELIEGAETSANTNQMPGNYPKENLPDAFKIVCNRTIGIVPECSMVVPKRAEH
jgi:hypothetical protein